MKAAALAAAVRMRWRGLEPPRGINPTRPSTLRVYQFRHQRAPAHCSRAFQPPRRALNLEPVRELCDEAVAAALGAGARPMPTRVSSCGAPGGRDEERPRRAARRRRERGDRRPRARRRRLGLRLRPAARRRRARDGRGAAAAAFAQAAPGGHDRALAPVEPARGTYRTPVESDPFAVSLADKVEHCLRAEQALAHDGVKVDRGLPCAPSASRSCSSPRTAPRSSRRSSSAAAGSTRWPQATGSRRSAATRARTAARARRPAGSTSSRSRLEREAPRVGEQAAALLRADAVPGRDHDGRGRLRADGAAGARVGRPPDRARPRLRHRGRLRGHELPQARTTSARCATAPST